MDACTGHKCTTQHRLVDIKPKMQTHHTCIALLARLAICVVFLLDLHHAATQVASQLLLQSSLHSRPSPFRQSWHPLNWTKQALWQSQVVQLLLRTIDLHCSQLAGGSQYFLHAAASEALHFELQYEGQLLHNTGGAGPGAGAGTGTGAAAGGAVAGAGGGGGAGPRDGQRPEEGSTSRASSAATAATLNAAEPEGIVIQLASLLARGAKDE